MCLVTSLPSQVMSNKMKVPLSEEEEEEEEEVNEYMHSTKWVYSKCELFI